MRPICYLKAKCSLRGKDIPITARLKLGTRRMKAVDYRNHVSTDHRSHHCDGLMSNGCICKHARKDG